MSGSRRIKIDQLAATIDKILEEYEVDVNRNLDLIVKEVVRKGASAVKSQASSAVGGSGKYAKGWGSKVQTGRLRVEGTIYNRTLPGLPHLLEHGHALRNGGRTGAKTHIAPVEQALVREFEQKVKSKL